MTKSHPYPSSLIDFGDGVEADEVVTASTVDAVVAALVDDDNNSATSIALSSRFYRSDTVEEVAVTAEAIHAALVELGLITAVVEE